MNKKEIVDKAWRCLDTQGQLETKYKLLDCVDQKEPFIQGFVKTPFGFVYCYSDKFWHDGECTQMIVVFEGLEYCRWINKAYTKKGLAGIARKFANEIWRKT